MAGLYKRPFCVVSAFVVPLLTLFSPNWLSLSGVGPYWAVLWLLPWAIVDGPLSAAIAGLCLGLVQDGINLPGVTQIPALVVLGLWWGRIGRRSLSIEQSFNLGLLAWVGTVFVGLSFWLQIVLIHQGKQSDWLHACAWHTLLSQALLTGFIAPIVGSLLFFLWTKMLRK